MNLGYPEPKAVYVYFHLRSPYCYLASKNMWPIVDDFHTQLVWRPLGGWHGRSPPDRAKVKIPLARQDLARHARRLGIPCVPPPITTDATLAGVGSLLAEERGLLRPYLVEMYRAEWAAGQDIGQPEVRNAVAAAIGLEVAEYAAYCAEPANQQRLLDHWEEAQAKGVVGVPSFVIDDQVFWGNDRIDFVLEYLNELRLARR
ncbi:MAG: 2-hydroxychromene-2-carboxylate isomerase [Gammaproteobacteria bacterium]|nr:2-hydroxychromene-2-carboxylate isomerase [Gammaproteobacteria bacterium]